MKKENNLPKEKQTVNPPPFVQPSSTDRAKEALRIQQSNYKNTKTGVKQGMHKVGH